MRSRHGTATCGRDRDPDGSSPPAGNGRQPHHLSTTGVPAVRTSPAVAGIPVMVTIALAAVGCGGGGSSAVESEAAVDSGVPPDTTLVESPRFRVRVRRASLEQQFPHGPHRDIACGTCHSTVPSHATHQQLECLECHRTPADYGSLRVLSDRECLECHHGEETGLRCADCHDPGGLEGTAMVTGQLRLVTWDQARDRQLIFDHSWHADLECGDCHAATIEHAATTECQSCHEDHHLVDATCSRCHEVADEVVHAEAAHGGCGGAGCHEDAVVAALPPIRALCLSCHTDMADHEAPEKECADCHRIPASWPRAPAPVGGAP